MHKVPANINLIIGFLYFPTVFCIVGMQRVFTLLRATCLLSGLVVERAAREVRRFSWSVSSSFLLTTKHTYNHFLRCVFSTLRLKDTFLAGFHQFTILSLPE